MPKKKIKKMCLTDIEEDLEIDRSEVYHLINKHGLPAFKFGGKYHVDWDSYEKWKKEYIELS